MPNRKKLIQNRLRRLRGQLEGVERMLDSDAKCEDILAQMKAVRSGTVGATKAILELRYCKKDKPISQRKLKEILEIIIKS